MLLLIGTTIESIVSVFLNLIGITYAVGKAIAYILSNAGEVAVDTFSLLSQCAIIFIEDLKMFAADVDDKYSQVVKVMHRSLVNSVGDVIGCISGTATQIFNTFETGKNCILDIITHFIDAFTWIAITARSTVVLVGNSVWIIIMFIPNLVIFATIELFKILETIVTNIFTSAKATTFATTDYIGGCIQYFASIPVKSALGMLAVIFIVIHRRETIGVIQYVTQRLLRILLAFVQKCFRLGIGVYLIAQMVFSIVYSALQLNRRRYEVDNINTNYSSDESHSDNELGNGTATTSTAKQWPNSDLCVICQDRPKSIVLLPCRHLCLCRYCAHHLRAYRTTCPLCRKGFRETIQVYV